jgi:hypothetical protein
VVWEGKWGEGGNWQRGKSEEQVAMGEVVDVDEMRRLVVWSWVV